MSRKFAIALPLIALASPAGAWGPIGHRVSADLAERNISGRTRAHVEMILGTTSLRGMSTLPDEQRQNPDPFWQASVPYHRITLPRGRMIDEVEHPPEGDALTALETFTAILRDPDAARLEKERALAFIVHIVADTHLPVHVNDEVHGGAGGVEVLWFGARRDLHWVWDEGLINHRQLSSAEYADRLAERTTPQQVLAWCQPDPSAWMQESADLRTRVYAEVDGATGPMRLHYQYVYDWAPVMEQRLQQSGYRLAAYLDWVFAAVD